MTSSRRSYAIPPALDPSWYGEPLTLSERIRMIDRTPLNEYSGPVRGFGEALETLRQLGVCPPQKRPVVLPGSLRPHHRPDKAWVYDEANREWLSVDSPEPRRALIQRLLRGRQPMWWRAVEQRVERALQAPFN